jgi:hypothetical protein
LVKSQRVNLDFIKLQKLDSLNLSFKNNKYNFYKTINDLRMK